MNKEEVKRLLVRKLALKSYSTLELKVWFKQKGVPEAIFEPLLQEFEQLGYLNDAAWLASFVRQQRARRYGARTIALKLKQKGFSDGEIAAVLGEDDETLIQELLKTRYKSRNLKDPREKQKVVASLARRGFSLEMIFRALNLDSEGF